MKFKLIIALTAAVSLSGCSTIIKGSNQTVAFDTGSVEGATCNVTGGSEFSVNETVVTPGELRLPRSKKALEVSCSKPGFGTGTKTVRGEIEPWVFGNIVFGGVLGAGIDAATGSVYRYPGAKISVELPNGG